MSLASKGFSIFFKQDEFNWFFSNLYKRQKIQIKSFKKEYCRYFSVNNFDTIVLFLTEINLLKDSKINLEPNLKKHWRNINANESPVLDDTLLELFLSYLVNNEEFNLIFNEETLTYNSDNKAVIKRNLVPQKAGALFKFLLNTKRFFEEKGTPNFILESKLQEKIELLINKKANDKRRKVTQAQIDASNIAKKKQGDKAEKWVLGYEKKRLKSHHNKKLISNIERISVDDASAGYDLISFQNENSFTLDKFIEVKSFSTKRSFFWTRNEVKVAREKGNLYSVYLININKISEAGYEPIEIKNPAELFRGVLKIFDQNDKSFSYLDLANSNNQVSIEDSSKSFVLIPDGWEINF